LPGHSQTARQPVDFLFAEGRLHLPAAVGALGAVDPGPHAARGSKDVLVDLSRLEIALKLQELAKPVVFVLFFLCLRAYLHKIESHIFPLISLSRRNVVAPEFEAHERVSLLVFQ
jgi:hypothetical protein